MRDRVFFDAVNPDALLGDIDAKRPWFVPTRMRERLNQHVDLVVRLPDGGEADIEAVVVARRLRKPGSPLAQGLQVVAVPGAGVTRLRQLLLGKRPPMPAGFAESRVETREELLRIAEGLLRGEVELVPVDRSVERGSQMYIQMLAPGAVLVLLLEVVGVGHVDDGLFARVLSHDPEDASKMRRLLAGGRFQSSSLPLVR